MKFIHAADIHLDSPLRGLENYEGAPVEQIRNATRRALTKLVDLCLAERVSFLLIAGDVFDADWKDFNTALFVVKELQRLDQAGIPVFLIFGNHDSVQEMSRQTPWPKNVTVFDHQRPETQRLDELQVALHGRSFPRRVVEDNWVPSYPQPVPGYFNIGLLHTNANGNPNHARYAPASVSELVAKGYQYWALGHVHEFQTLHEHPHVVYSGNLQGRHAREVGSKGCVLVTVADREIRDIEFRSTDVLRWHRLTVKLQPTDGRDDVLTRVRSALQTAVTESDGLFGAMRLELVGRCQAHRELVQNASRLQMTADIRALASEFGDDVWIEKIKFQTQSPLDFDQLRLRQDHVGALLRLIDEVSRDETQLLALSGELTGLATKLASDLKGGAEEDAVRFDDPAQLRTWLNEAETLLVNRLEEELH